MTETMGLPKSMDGDELYKAFLKVFSEGTSDRAGHNQLEEIPEKLRTPFLRNIQKALRKKGEVVPQQAFTKAIQYFINDIHKGGNAVNFLYDAEGNDISDQVMSYYNNLKRKVGQLKKKYSMSESSLSMDEVLLEEFIREALDEEKKKKASDHPPEYDAPEGSKRDEKLDAAKAAYKRGDIEKAVQIRKSMEKKEREKQDRKDEGVEGLRTMIRELISEALSAKVKATLRKKAEKRGLTPGSVYAEYKKGLAAWVSSGSRKGMSQHQWAMARVNSANPSKSWATVKKSKAKKKK